MHSRCWQILPQLCTIMAREEQTLCLNTGDVLLFEVFTCKTVLRILFSKLGERINIHFAVMRSILRNSERKPSWTRQRPRLRSNTIYEFAAQFTNASYMVANRYSFNPKHREMAFPYGICKAAPFAKLLHWWNHSVQRTYFLIITVKNFDTGGKW